MANATSMRSSVTPSTRYRGLSRSGQGVLRILKDRSGFLAVLVAMALFLCLCLLLARTVWLMAAPLEVPEISPTVIPSRVEAIDYAATITARNPFATADSSFEAAPVAGTETLRETTLNFEYKGTMRYGDRVTAIIDTKDARGQDVYVAGTDLTDGIRLAEIFLDHVIIERNGNRETLTLDRLKRSGVRPANNQSARSDLSPPLPDRRASETPTPVLDPNGDDDDDEIESFNLPTVTDIVRFRVRPHNGELALLLYPGREGQLFEQAGLKARDILISVNGSPLPADIRRAQALLRDVGKSGSVNVMVEREGTPQNITVDFARLIDLNRVQTIDRNPNDGIAPGDEVKL